MLLMKCSMPLLLLLLQLINLVQAKGRPHIVIITADDMGWNDVSFHGSNQIKTPNIDALAYDGVILNRHYSAPMCTPTRAALMTGKHPINIGMQHFVIDSDEPWGLGLDQRILPEYFRDAGYRTHMVGKWHLGFFAREYTPTMRGFDSHIGYLGPYIDYWNYMSTMGNKMFTGYDMRRNLSVDYLPNGTYVTDFLTTAATTIIDQHNLNEPLLMVVNHLAPHAGNDDDPLQAPRDTIDRFAYIHDKSRRIYAAMLSKLDDSIGAIVQSLRRRRMLDNCIVVFLADNGAPTVGLHANAGSNFPLRGQKNSPWEGAVRTAALVWSPLLKRNQRVSNQLMHISDWLPTLASAAGVAFPSATNTIDGIDQWKALCHDTGSPRKVLMNMLDEIFGYTSYIDNGIKYINGTTVGGAFDQWYGNPDSRDTLPHDDAYYQMVLSTNIAKTANPKLTSKVIKKLRNEATVSCGNIASKIPCEPLEGPCLFDIVNDPCETNNIAALRFSTVRNIYNRVEWFRRVAAVPRNKPHDFDADPAKHGGVWTWWKADEGDHCGRNCSKNI